MEWQVFVIIIIFSHLFTTVHNAFVVTRGAKEEPDAFLVVTDTPETQYNKESFDKVGIKQCLNSKNTISSVSSILYCYNDVELQKKENCSDGVFSVASEDKTQPIPDCTITSMDKLSVWDYNQAHIIESLDHTEELKFRSGSFHFKNRLEWDGLLVKMYYSCTYSRKRCSIFKFTGNRTHPLPNSIKYILKQPATPFTTQFTTHTTNTTNNNNNDNGSKAEKGTSIIVGIIIPIILIIIIILFICLWRLRTRRTKKKDALCSDDVLAESLCRKQVTEDQVSYTEPGSLMPEYQEIELDDDDELKKDNAEYSTIKPYKVKTLTNTSNKSEEKSEYYYSTPYSWFNRLFRRNQQNTSTLSTNSNYYSTPISNERDEPPVNLSEMYAQVKKY